MESVARRAGGFETTTTAGGWRSRNVVVATGDCDVPRIPWTSGLPSGVLALPSSRYVAPDLLPDGNVLVVGAGPTGQQLALELARAGRSVTIAVGRHARLPRRYRGRDVWRWIDELGDFDDSVDDLPDADAARRTPSVTLSGANGGEDLDLGVLQRAGVVLAGRLVDFDGDEALFGNGLATAVDDSDRRMRRVLGRIDALADAAGASRQTVGDVEVPRSPARVDLRKEAVRIVIWATGFRRSYPWLHVPVLDTGGELVHHHGVTSVPGLYALGLKFQRRRRSHFIGGVGDDAAFLAERIVDLPAQRAA